jgi:hypothetical protein
MKAITAWLASEEYFTGLHTKRGDEAGRDMLRAESFIVPDRRTGAAGLVCHAS